MGNHRWYSSKCFCHKILFPSLVAYNVFSKTISQKCVLEIKFKDLYKTSSTPHHPLHETSIVLPLKPISSCDHLEELLTYFY